VVLVALAFSGAILFFSFRKPPDRQNTAADPTPAPTAAPAVTPAPSQPAAVAATTVKLFSEMPLAVLVDKAQISDKQQGLIPVNSLPDGEHSLELVVQGFRHNIKFSADEHGVSLPDPGAPSHCDTVVFSRRDGKWSAVSSIQDGEVTIDGQPVAGLPKAEGVPLGDGSHNISVKMAGKPAVSQNFQIVPSDRLLVWVRPLVPVLTVETNLEKFEVLVRGKVWATVNGNRFSFRRYPADRFEVSVRKEDHLVAPETFVFDKRTTKVPSVRFELKPRPKHGYLVVQADRPNVQVSLDNNNIGVTDANGHFEFREVQPGEHRIDLSFAGHEPKAFRRRFVLGETTTLSRAETRLDIQMGTLAFELNPPTMRLTFTKDGDSTVRQVTGAEIRVEPGSYTFTGTAPGYQQGRTRVTIAAGGRQKVTVALAAEPKPTPRPAAPVSIWSDGATWKDAADGFQTQASNVGVLFLRQPDPRIVDFHAKWSPRRKFVWYSHYESDKDYVRWVLDNRDLNVDVMVAGKRRGLHDFKHGVKDLSEARIRIVMEPQQATITIEGKPAPTYRLPRPMSGRFGIVNAGEPFFIKGFSRQ
jgi:hypothetical protein